jgi:hypothetical protein
MERARRQVAREALERKAYPFRRRP